MWKWLHWLFPLYGSEMKFRRTFCILLSCFKLYCLRLWSGRWLLFWPSPPAPAPPSPRKCKSSPRVAGIFQFLVIFSMAQQMTKSQHFNNVLWLSRIITLGLPFRPARVCVMVSVHRVSWRVCVCKCASANKAEIKILPGRDQW